MTANELLTYLFTGSPHSFAGPLGGWLQAAPRFQAFVEAHRDKIRKKVRGLRDAETRQDLQAELGIAYWLLQDRRVAVAYETVPADQGRGPDFTAVFRTHTRFNVEVTRLRGARPPAGAEEPAAAAKLANTICAKLGQLPPSAINVLALVMEPGAYAGDDVVGAIRLLTDRATRQEDAFFVARGFLSARDFARRYPRLSAIVLRALPVAPILPQGFLWVNPQARHPLPADLQKILL